jgi:hypothetical protein
VTGVSSIKRVPVSGDFSVSGLLGAMSLISIPFRIDLREVS